MTHVFKDHFSQVSEAYRAFRPAYPEELFRWLAKLCPRHDAALDCGCGTGQAAVALTPYFARVYAVDPSAEQIAKAVGRDRVSYLVAPAEATGLPPQSQDLIIAAQALHWFDFEPFYAEVRRLARPGTLFAAFTYGLVAVNAEVDAVIRRLYSDLLGPYWPPERRHVDEGYRSLPFPFREIDTPGFEMGAAWQFDHLVGYLGTWSAVKEYRARIGADPLEAIRSQLLGAWGGEGETRGVHWPLFIRVGLIE